MSNERMTSGFDQNNAVGPINRRSAIVGGIATIGALLSVGSASASSLIADAAKERFALSQILLIHGLFGSLSDPKILSQFSPASVLAPDLIGYGENRGVKRRWTLEDQADYLANWLKERQSEPIHVVGHSVGGAVATLFAHRHPTLTKSLTLVEGNLTLGDAFWSRKISTETLAAIDKEVGSFKRDVGGWLAQSGVPATPWTLATATGWLANQPSRTLRSQARAVVTATGSQNYLDIVKRLLDDGLPLHLLAGARSRKGWNVPTWLAQRANSNADIPETGHLMMLEQPEAFAKAIMSNLAG